MRRTALPCADLDTITWRAHSENEVDPDTAMVGGVGVQVAATCGEFRIDATAGYAEVDAHLLVTSGGSVASLDVFLAGSETNHCEARAVGVPTT